MAAEPSTIAHESDGRLRAAVAAFEQARNKGPAPDPKEWIARYPDLTEGLQAYFASQGYLPLHGLPIDRKPAPGFGEYEILEEVGRGGMGSVYRARQASLNRTVALKVIRADKFVGLEPQERAGWAARFHQEAEAVADLDHPNIVPIYEVGEYEGQPFFSMKFVEGGSLKDHLERYAADPKSAARLVATVARAVQHAHQRGILHRDLKPADILLDTEGQPHVTDFGLAKRLEGEGDLTQSGAAVGTPGYMAPEQARAEKRLTTAADVYGLGAILYALLTGRKPPFAGVNPLETLRQVLEQEPEPPRLLNPCVDRDLETVCLKCLKKEPRERFHSAKELADDLQRVLECRPVRARPTPAWERAWKWAKRRPAAAALLAVSAAAVLALTVGALVFAGVEASLRDLAEEEKNNALRQKAEAERQRRRADDQRDETLRQKETAEKQRRRADANLQKAFEAGDQLLTQVQGRLARVPGMERVRYGLLQKARAFYAGFAATEGNALAVRLQTGMANHRVGMIQQQLGQYQNALRSCEAAVRLLRGVADENPNDPGSLLVLGVAYRGRAVALQALNQHAEAERAYAAAVIAMRRATSVTPHPEFCRELAASLDSWAGFLQKDATRHNQAKKAYREALGLLEKLCAEHPHEEQYRAQRAHALGNLGTLLLPASPQQAQVAWEQGLKLFEKLAEDHPDAPEYRLGRGEMLLNLGLAWELGGQPKRAARAYAEALELLERLVEDFPRTTDYRHQLARAYTMLGLLHAAARDFEQADAARAQARRHWERLVKEAPDRATVARSRVDLAESLLREGKTAEAKAALARAIELQEGLVKRFAANAEYRTDLAGGLMNRGLLFAREKRLAEEEEQYRRAIALLEQARGKARPPAGWLTLRLRVQQALILALRERNEWGKLTAAVRASIRYQEEVVAGAPADTGARRLLRSYHVVLLDGLGRLGDHAGVSRAAKAYEPLLHEAGPAASDLVQAAGLVARCVPLAEKDKGLLAAKREELARAYGDQAMGLLRAAVERGYRDADRLRTAADFQPLAERTDLRKLLKELEADKGGGNP